MKKVEMLRFMLGEIVSKTGTCKLVYEKPGWTCFFLKTRGGEDDYSEDNYVKSPEPEGAVEGALYEVIRRDGVCGECLYFREFIRKEQESERERKERGMGSCICAGGGHSMSHKDNKIFCRCFTKKTENKNE